MVTVCYRSAAVESLVCQCVSTDIRRYTRISVTKALQQALREVRWETPSGEELASRIATVFRAQCGAKGVEVCIDRAAWLHNFVGADAGMVAVSAPGRLVSGSRGRPKSGWGSTRIDRVGTTLRAGRRYTIPLPCRHTDAYVVVWAGREVGGLSSALAEVAGSLALAVDAHVLLHRVAKLSRDAHSDNRRLRRDLRDALDDGTASPAMRHCLERADAVAPYTTPVLITGPSGSGKELVARRIHMRSGRAHGPFVKLNCGAVPEALAVSELFGHERGAFTGAVAKHRGVFERAAGGTLLLDEVGELSPATQVKLLRVLQEGTFTPVGSETERRSDARVVAATHRDLRAETLAGVFREDLLYRLAVFEVEVPSLAERREDLPRLVHAILQRIATRMAREVPSVPRPVMAKLAAHAWPGNVRELENVLEGALVMSKGPQLEVPLAFADPRREHPTGIPVQSLDLSIRVAIEAALQASGGKLYGPDGAAALLELNPATLQSKMRKLGVDRQRFTA